MTRVEFAECMGYAALAVGKPLPKEATEVYYDLLGDLPLDVLRLAVKRVVLEHRWATFPTVAEFRAAASEAMCGRELTAGEAMALVRRAVSVFSFQREAAALASLPPLVAQAVDALGWRTICDSTEPEIWGAQFRKAYETLVARERRQAILPPSVARMVQAIGNRHLPAPVAGATGEIGNMESAS